ncbi:MAG: DUF4232 domain-containing protein [Acidimicrobiales bacterium]
MQTQSGLRRCAVSQLGVSSTNGQQALDNAGLVYVLRNTSSTSCTLEGYPGLALVSTAGKTTDLSATREPGGGYLFPTVPEQLVTVAPGKSASFWVEFTAQSCVTSGKVEITPPDDHAHLTVPNDHILPCASHFEVSPVGLGIAQPNTGGSPTLPTLTTASFPAPASTALAAFTGHTSVPLVAPTSLPTGLSARTLVASGGYEVSLYHCGRAFGLNNPAIGGAPDCAGEAAVFGSFGGQLVPSATSRTLINLLGTPPSCPPGAGTTESTVILGDGVQGMLTTSMGGVCDLRWTQRGWIIDIGQSGGTLAQVKPLASQVINTMSTERLPSARGLLAIADVGDGEHTTASWLQGKFLYQVGAYHLASVALTLLGSVASASASG